MRIRRSLYSECWKQTVSENKETGNSCIFWALNHVVIRPTMSPWVPSTAFVHPQFPFRNLPNPQSQVMKWIYSNRFILHLMSAPLPYSSPIFLYLIILEYIYLIYILFSQDSNHSRYPQFLAPCHVFPVLLSSASKAKKSFKVVMEGVALRHNSTCFSVKWGICNNLR